jgi:hypothetical protein
MQLGSSCSLRHAAPVPFKHTILDLLLLQARRHHTATAQSRVFNIQIQASWGDGQNSSNGEPATQALRLAYCLQLSADQTTA